MHIMSTGKDGEDYSPWWHKRGNGDNELRVMNGVIADG